MKNFIIRALSGVLYAVLIIASILIDKFTFVAFFAILLILGMVECNRLIADKGQSAVVKVIDIVAGLSLFFATFAVTSLHIQLSQAAIAPISLFIVRLIAGLYLKEESPIKSWANSFFNILYVAMPLSMLAILYSFTPILALFVLFLIWINDTGAFMVGCTIGKHRLFERISPKKSWEGFFGGFFLCIAAGFAISYFCGDEWKWAILGGVVSAFATWGDLVESLIKRTLNVKDSGNIMPGHGGILDRIDSLLLVAPAVLVYCLIILEFL